MRDRARPFVFALALAPLLWLAGRALAGRLGVNPIEEVTHETGIWALRFLLLTLAVTPVRQLTGWSRPAGYRRMLGLFAFAYAALHLAAWLALDLFFDWNLIVADLTRRRFIMAGMVAFVAMVPLAVTSTRGWMRRLGRRWQSLHRLVYVAAIAAAVHYLWKVKVAFGSPVWYAALVAALLLSRLFRALRQGALSRAP